MGILASRIVFALASFVALGFIVFLLEVMHLFSVDFIRILAGLAFIFVGIYAIYLLMKDLRERRRRSALIS